jgi:hypothetical protein
MKLSSSDLRFIISSPYALFALEPCFDPRPDGPWRARQSRNGASCDHASTARTPRPQRSGTPRARVRAHVRTLKIRAAAVLLGEPVEVGHGNRS